jgi:dTDP-4-amino-4,6-dideoxygalactose transaminase
MFAKAGLDSTLTLPVELAGYRHIFNQFVIRGGQRDALRDHLTTRGVGTEIYYPVPFHRQKCFAHSERPGFSPAGRAFPHADAAAATSLALPIYGELTAAQQQHVVDAIAEFYAA